MIDLAIQLNTRLFEKALHLVPRQLREEIKDGLDHLSRKFLKVFRSRRLKGPPGIRGRPRGIFTHFHRKIQLSHGIEDMAVSIFTDSKIARLHEEGGIVRDPAGGMIAVPLSARQEMFTRSGALKTRYKNIKSLPNIIARKFGEKIFLVRVKKRSREILPFFVLKRQVLIKARMGFYQLFLDMAGAFYRILNKSFETALYKAWRVF